MSEVIDECVGCNFYKVCACWLPVFRWRTILLLLVLVLVVVVVVVESSSSSSSVITIIIINLFMYLFIFFKIFALDLMPGVSRFYGVMWVEFMFFRAFNR